jgi:S-adenosyl-L-methionine hydrolase (adenosine-forming)
MEDRLHGATFVLFTDFGADDIYVGQVKAALLRHAPGGVIIDLLHRAPAFVPKAGAHLLAALESHFPKGVVFLAVIDPGVGGSREAVAIEADDKWYVGPDNGLLSVVAARAKSVRSWRIVWRPETLSASFHGRDLFAPIAAWIADRGITADKLQPTMELEVQLGAGDLAEIIHVDHYGNALTGLRAGTVPRSATLEVQGRVLDHARVFAEVPPGMAFWYENSIGLIEIAVNCGSAAGLMNLATGIPVRLIV